MRSTALGLPTSLAKLKKMILLLGWRRDAALAFDETNFDDSVLDMERVVVLSSLLCSLTQPLPVAWTSGPCDLWPRSLHPRTLSKVWYSNGSVSFLVYL